MFMWFFFLSHAEIAWDVKAALNVCLFTVYFTVWLFTGCQQGNYTHILFHLKLRGCVYSLFAVRNREFLLQSLLTTF